MTGRPPHAHLAALGVHPELLTPAQRQALDEDGWLLLPDVLDAASVEEARAAFDRFVALEGEAAGSELGQVEPGIDRLANLVDKGAAFRPCFTTPLVLAALVHVLGEDLKLSSLNGRSARRGAGQQGLHADGPWPQPPRPQVANSIWVLDDFTVDNGATRLVPGSHRWPGPAPDVDRAGREAVTVVAPAGSVAVFNAHVLHGGTANTTDRPRRAVHGYFTLRHLPQQTDQRRWVSADTLATLSEQLRWLIDA